MIGSFALTRLLALCSPSLPIGGFAYSEGMEGAVCAGLVHDAESAEDWILGRLELGVGRVELPLLDRLYRAWRGGDRQGFLDTAALAHAMRETRELREADRHLGQALLRLLTSLEVPGAEILHASEHVGLLPSFAVAAVAWQVPLEATLVGFAWSWLDAQTSAAVKLVPLGQTDGQRLLLRASSRVDEVVQTAQSLSDAEIGAGALGLALCSAQHENQYSRLFRS